MIFRDLTRILCCEPEDILLGGARPKGKIMLLDAEGMHTSAGIAELLASAGAEVIYVTGEFSPVSGRLIDSFEVKPVMQRMKNAGVKFLTSTWARGIGDHAMRLYDVHSEEEWDVTGIGTVHPLDRARAAGWAGPRVGG